MRSDEISSGETIYAQDINAIRADAYGASQLLSHQQLGALAIGTQPTTTHTITLTVNGTAIVLTAVAAIGSTAGNFLIGATDAATLANLMQLLANPSITSTTQVALSTANQLLLSYLDFALVGTTITISSLNTVENQKLSSFTCSTTIVSATYTAQTMQLFVEPGVVNVNGTQVKFLGGSTPTVTAPVSHPRIDVLTIDNTGTLAWTTGTENASPAVPTYPANKVPICEVLNVVGETTLNDNLNFNASQGWIQADVRPMIGSPINLGAITASIIPAADNTYNLGGASFEWANVYAKNNVYVNGLGVAISKFGGTGTDGALAISSGITTLGLSSASYFEKNYTSISITGTTGGLAFSSPNNTTGTTVALKSQGAVTITSSATRAIDMRSMGGGLGNAVKIADNGGPSTYNGLGGSGAGSCAGPGNQGGVTFPTGGGAAFSYTVSIGGPGLAPLSPLVRFAPPGGNGCSGGSGGSNGFSAPGGGGGGLGAGGLYIECGGAYNFTGTIDLTGQAGSTGASGGGGSTTSGCGGGGAGGNCLVLYFSLTADSGTYSVTAGAGGTGTGNSGAAAAAGATFRGVNNYHA